METTLSTIADIKGWAQERTHIDIAQRVEDTFGPNPCDQLKLIHKDGSTIRIPCNGKRCIHCGPRKEMLITLQMEAGFGQYAYITTFTSRQSLDRCIEKVRKAATRAGEQLLLQSVGDPTLGWIVTSNRPMEESQRLTTLADWTRRIIERYHHSVNRIRRSYLLGRLSLVRIRRTTKSGQPSPWHYQSHDSDIVDTMKDLDWDELMVQVGGTTAYKPAIRPDLSLPDPF